MQSKDILQQYVLCSEMAEITALPSGCRQRLINAEKVIGIRIRRPVCSFIIVMVRRFGLGKKSAYALALIGMEETKSGLSPLANSFSRNAPPRWQIPPTGRIPAQPPAKQRQLMSSEVRPEYSGSSCKVCISGVYLYTAYS